MFLQALGCGLLADFTAPAKQMDSSSLKVANSCIATRQVAPAAACNRATGFHQDVRLPADFAYGGLRCSSQTERGWEGCGHIGDGPLKPWNASPCGASNPSACEALRAPAFGYGRAAGYESSPNNAKARRRQPAGLFKRQWTTVHSRQLRLFSRTTLVRCGTYAATANLHPSCPVPNSG